MALESQFDVLHLMVEIPEKQFTLIPLGDIHHNAPMFAQEKWKATLKDIKARMKNEVVLFIGMGDYLETFSFSGRRAMRDLHESEAECMDDVVNKYIKNLVKDLEFTKGHWIGMLTGNHDYTNGDGKTTTQILAQKLDTYALGVMGGIKLNLKFKKHNTRYEYDIFAHHGKGGGQLPGSTINALARWGEGFNGDLLLMGHDHSRQHAALSRMCLRVHNGELIMYEKPWHAVRTGSFLKGYDPGKSSYVCRAAMRPKSLGVAEIFIRQYASGKGKTPEHLSTKVTT